MLTLDLIRPLGRAKVITPAFFILLTKINVGFADDVGVMAESKEESRTVVSLNYGL